MKILKPMWRWWSNLGIRTPKEMLLDDLQSAQRMLVEWERRREEAAASVTMLRLRITRLKAEDEAFS